MNIVSAQELEYFQDLNMGTLRVHYSDGTSLIVPKDPANRHYAEIMRQVEAGELTIEEAE